MNRNVRFSIISEIILLTVIKSTTILYNSYEIASEPYYIIIIKTINCVPDICNILMLFQFVNLVFMTKQGYSHLKKRLTYWINRAVRGPICLKKEN